MTKFEGLEEFAAHLTTLGVEAPTLQLSATATLRPGEKAEEVVRAEAIRTLPELNVQEGEGLQTLDTADFVALRTLGEGGMGLVRLANQVAMDREVAVKTSRKATDEWAKHALLEEAYTTGYLEHPNIVPVYTVGKTADGAPLIVMKRIEGDSWRELVEREREAGTFELKRHLEILMQVCDALRFAHSRGVIHRDVKLENVMIGAYREIYLLDWGIALYLGDEKERLPTKGGVRGLSGTPNYMAPEMAQQEVEKQDERTDVYLLGATLHELLTGRPRHEGKKVLHVLFAAAMSEPVDYEAYGEEVPRELGEIANRACAREREERYGTVEAFQAAVRGYQEHRESVMLAQGALKKAEALVDECAREERDLFLVHDLYGESRFGFRQALRMWPENEVARQGYRGCLEVMIAHHVETENLDGARAVLGEYQEEVGEEVANVWQEKVEGLERELALRAQDYQKLQRMAAGFDLSKNPKARSLFTLFLGIFWGGTTFLAAMRGMGGGIGLEEQLLSHFEAGIRNLAIVGGLLLVFRRQLFVNRITTAFFSILGATVTATAFIRWTAYQTGTPIVMANTTDMVLYSLALFAAGFLSDRRLGRLAIFFGGGAVLGVFFPAFQLHLEAVATVATLAGISWLWWPKD